MAELLTLDDPLLPRVRKVAERSADAHAWLLDSARRWAIGQFATRELPSADNLEERIRALRLKQVAVLVRDQPADERERESERVMVGLLQSDTGDDEYLKLGMAHGKVFSGMIRILDMFELPRAWQVRIWMVYNEKQNFANLSGLRRPVKVKPSPCPACNGTGCYTYGSVDEYGQKDGIVTQGCAKCKGSGVDPRYKPVIEEKVCTVCKRKWPRTAYAEHVWENATCAASGCGGDLVPANSE